MLFAAAHFFYYANNIIRPYFGTDQPKGRPQAVPAVQ